MNIYVTSEPASKLRTLISNFRNFYVIDVQEFVSRYRLDATLPANVYLINRDLEADVLSVARLKKWQGIFYVNRKLDRRVCEALRARFGKSDRIDKFVMVDNGNAPKHQDLYGSFDEVFFFRRFRKNKIVECAAPGEPPRRR